MNDSEGSYLSDMLEGLMWDEDERRDQAPHLANLAPDAVERYNKNKAAKVGEPLRCPACDTRFTKRSYQQAFCGTKGKGSHLGKGTRCKDTYHNSVNDERRLRAEILNPNRR